MPLPTAQRGPYLRDLGYRPYEEIWAAMRRFTADRNAETRDELWLVEHPPVFTQGRNGRPEHLFHTGTIPVIQTDRGGQVTYHGPGQAVAYSLMDLHRLGLTIRDQVTRLEQGVIELMAALGLVGCRQQGAPGVYLDHPEGPKIAFVGLRVRSGRTYHGISLNVTNSLTPFTGISPCGQRGLAVGRLADRLPGIDPFEIRGRLGQSLAATLYPTEESTIA